MILKKLILGTCVLACSQMVLAKPSINEMQSCQGLLDFVESKLTPAPSQYAADDVKKVLHGLKKYNDYIQQSIVSPGLLQFNQGDAAKAAAMQTQVDTYKATLVKSFSARYPQHRLFADQAVAVNNCAKQAVPSGQALEDLKTALNTMLALAQQ